jgi:hypothetical protein
MKLWNRLVSVLATLAVLLVSAPPAAAQFAGWRFSEFQPNIPNGGRANTIAVHPSNSDIMLVAAETGGLFRTTNRGANWTHIDRMPEFQLNSVAYLPADPNIVILTAAEDFRVANGGGIWRSRNGGLAWTQVTPGPPRPAGVTARLTAWEISIAPDNGTIYVAHNYGLSISTDRGVTWTHRNPFGTSEPRVFSVVAQRGNRVIVGGPAGIRRSPDAGVTWLAPVTGPGAIADLHALGGSPLDPATAYVVNESTELWFTEDSGSHWTHIAGAPTGGGTCGGIAFIKPIGFQIERLPPALPLRSLQLWFGNRCGLATLNATPVPPPVRPTPGPALVRFTYGGSWTLRGMDHGDTRDLAFDPSRVPLLLATDGGLHNTADSGMTWTSIGGGNNGFNALQITEVKGQWITSLGRHDLYFGTQDNDLFASGDNGVSWINPVCCEGFFIEREHRVTTAADSKITFVACSGCGNFITDPLFSGLAGWPDVTSPSAGNPKILSRNVYVQGVETGGAFTKGMARTANRGGSWAQYADIPEDRRDIPKLAIPTAIRPVIYQPIRTGWYGPGDFEINTLARVVKNIIGTGATVGYPSNTNFGGLGINPTMFAWYQVFGVDPGNTTHIIAPDVVNEKMMETMDGGNNWTEIPGLTSLVTGGGTFLFRRSIHPFASAVSFSPDDPNKVAIGTWQNGVFVSGDRGATWQKVPRSQRATYITSIEWKSGNEAIVSSYGRGLWKMSWGLLRGLPDFVFVCREPCIARPFPPFDDPKIRFDEAVLVFNGRVMGGRIGDGVLQQLFVSPGSSVVFYSDAKKAVHVKVTETATEVGFGDAKAPQAPKEGLQLIGLQLVADKPVQAVYSAKPLPLYEPTEKERQEVDVDMRKESPTRGQPYIELNPSKGGTNSVGPGEAIEIVVRNLPPGMVVEIAIDAVVVEKGQASANGVLSMRVPAPRAFGLHSITLRDSKRKTIDGAMFLVKPQDEREKQKQ